MFRIGEFSKIAQTAVSQLRYYDQIGLFEPEHTDRFTGYRYYRAAQLPDLNRILAMKELGLALKQIKRLVEEDVSVDEIRGMLLLKKAQVEQEIQAKIDRLHYIEARLRQVEEEGQMSPDDIVIKELPAQPIYGFRITLPDIRRAIMYRMEMTQLLSRHIPKKKLGHFVAVLHEEAFVIKNADVQMGFFLNNAINKSFELSSGHKLTTGILPKVEMAACAVRLGGFENGYETYANLGRWVEANNYELAGPAREVFIVQAPPDRMDELVCEIQLPVRLKQRTSAPYRP